MLSDQNKALIKANDFDEHSCVTRYPVTLNDLMDLAREEGRQSAGERVAPPSEMDLGRAIWEARIRAAWPKQSAALRMAATPWPKHVADERAAEHDLALASARAVLALLSPQAAPAEQKDGAS